jgi:hypothetical protein
MASNVVASLLAGGFALVGSLGGIFFTGRLTQRAEQRRLSADDERRWLLDRRHIYAAYLTLAFSMHEELDGIGIFLPYKKNTRISDEDKTLIRDNLYEYYDRWHAELQPALIELQLIATPKVADLAERVTDALLDITSPVEVGLRYDDYYPGWYQARDLLQVLQDSMRTELGVQGGLLNPWPNLDDDWPWLPDRPSRESYIQKKKSPRQRPAEDLRDAEA